ncbi:hypothetical protein OG21DRAFT_669690 [Imleria badia]|nr:hypothetical protein OG21DRAFT_669690 [Imleria badia]
MSRPVLLCATCHPHTAPPLSSNITHFSHRPNPPLAPSLHAIIHMSVINIVVALGSTDNRICTRSQCRDILQVASFQVVSISVRTSIACVLEHWFLGQVVCTMVSISSLKDSRHA